MSTIRAIRRFLGADDRKATAPVQAIWNGAVFAESDRTVVIEGMLSAGGLQPRAAACASGRAVPATTNVVVDEQRNRAAAWYYPSPSPAAKMIKDHLAFWHGVKIRRSPRAPA